MEHFLSGLFRILYALRWSLDLIFSMPFQGNPYSGDEIGFKEIQSLSDLHRSKMMGE